MLRSDWLARRLAVAPPAVFVGVAGVFAFVAYCCVYAFRKPFTAGTYEGLVLWGVQFKIVLVVAQVAGYALSKFIGIRVISGMAARHRAATLLGVAGLAGVSLLGFALTPFPWNAAWMFVNGLPLGMAWGLVFGYLEGRRVTEALAAMLCVNFIISSGFVKTTGRWLLDAQGLSEQWMPFAAALLFVPGLLLCVWVMEHLPPPSKADEAQRAPRQKMSPQACRGLFWRYAPGLVLLVTVYLVLTIVRDVRDNFTVEIWRELGFGGNATILTTAEIPVAVLSLLAVGAMMFVRDNAFALRLNHLLVALGAVLLIGSTVLFQQGGISPIVWMVASGFGLFLPYILFNGVLFDRLLAHFRERGNVGFLIYVADSIGYLGSVGVLLWRNFGAGEMSWLGFYTSLCYGGAVLMLVLMAGSYWYFLKKKG
ncbi:MAG: hypothetical protein KF734_16165 [Saprospiraceae bacterium]|nr:hypothetical protein [Saprospiraceae bacterium]